MTTRMEPLSLIVVRMVFGITFAGVTVVAFHLHGLQSAVCGGTWQILLQAAWRS